ncbi:MULTISPECIES: indolepyruvate ferredoxin oxidoreductase family protein [Nocardia]|uniref:indolepyruvate ferredoxin oxidoreductase family protein n=1 Tax=Nocardia TaxID=1817 RepID=UPI000D69EB30|nr:MULTISPECIES: indolepyruvate ferredoxin oxidoreductase family protein [Nocardia]
MAGCSTPTATGASAAPLDYHLEDRYRLGAGPVLLSGAQAVARLLVEQQARDERAGLSTASLVSGYPGSPLAGLDKILAGVPELRTQHGMRLVPGLNEELAATSVWGSQTELPTGVRTVDGVVGIWYGKGPGVDRAGDALRHGSLYGAHPSGGVVVLAADDPGSKSSSVPCVSERSLAAMNIPVLYPRNATEVVTMGMHAVTMSRAAGVWVALKIVADVADGVFTVDADFAALRSRVPQIMWDGAAWTYRQRIAADPTDSLLAEADLLGPRWAMVEAYGAVNHLDVVEIDTADAWLGIVAAGLQYDAVRQALRNLGLGDDDSLRRAGIRLLRIGMPYPLGGTILGRFAEGLEELLVIEEKTPFIEAQVRDILYGRPGAPLVTGARDRDRKSLVPVTGTVTAETLLAPLRRVLRGRVELSVPPTPSRALLPLAAVRRTPYFCSGCPHNRSTVLPDGSIGAGGIGCHTMVTIASRETAQVTGITQMGGEGAQWIGQAPFTDVPHIFQNVGDGTFFHSGQLAVQACVAAGVNITYKVLYNQVVAMTGAQDAQGALGVAALTRKLHAEGVRRIIVCADEPGKYGRRAGFAPIVDVWHRDRLDEAQRILRDVDGVTVLIYDQQCAAEARRLRKRGKVAAQPLKVVINEAVCEGCGDCGVKSNCLSVQPVDTELGRKTRIDQTSCNTDYSCLAGDCPSFVTILTDPGATAPTIERRAAPAVPDPVLPRIADTWDVFLAGIGGTGVVTVNAVLAAAALFEGLRSAGLDQTGLSQKAGPVTSHLRLSSGEAGANRLLDGSADVILAFDLMVATDPRNLAVAGSGTTAVASTSRTATGEMVYDASVRYPEEGEMLERLSGASRQLISFDMLGAAERLLGSAEAANLMLVGAAVQAEALPISPASVRRAVELNGVAVEANLAAFDWGRFAVAEPAAFAELASPVPAGAAIDDGARYLRDSVLEGETRRLAGIRAAGLEAHSGPAAARGYVGLVESAWTAECALGATDEFSQAVARGAYHLMAYKDEYEVARLLTDPRLEAEVADQVPAGGRVAYNLHPPMLRAVGYDKKIRLPARTARPVLRTLARMKRLRGTAADPFGYAYLRRVERALVDDYVALVRLLADSLTPESYDTAAAAAGAAELVRGYEDVKLRNVARYRAERERLDLPLSGELIALVDRR